jgi:hypothetical protein
MKVSAQLICDILNNNRNYDGFIDSLRSRVSVTDDVANNSEVNCSAIDGGFDSSPLGFINMLADEPIGMVISSCSHSKGFGNTFHPMSKKPSINDEVWNIYIASLDKYNKENGTNHKPEKRPTEGDE